jgi:hypothetical protein
MPQVKFLAEYIWHGICKCNIVKDFLIIILVFRRILIWLIETQYIEENAYQLEVWSDDYARCVCLVLVGWSCRCILYAV